MILKLTIYVRKVIFLFISLKSGEIWYLEKYCKIFNFSLCVTTNRQYLSRLNLVQKETMWPLILQVVPCVCTQYVCSMYVVGMWYFAQLITVFTYIDVFPWDLDTIILGQSHTCDLNRCGVKGHLGVNDLWYKYLQKSHCIHIL